MAGVAVLRLSVGTSLGFTDGLSDNYNGYDLVLVVNLTGLNLQNPAFGAVAPGGSPGFTAALSTGGQTLTALNANTVWATLVQKGTNYTFNFSATGVDPLSTALTAYSGVPSTPYKAIASLTSPALPTGATVPGLNALAVSPNGQQIYAVNASLGALISFDAASMTEQQYFTDGQDGVTGLGGADAVAVSVDGSTVYVASGGDRSIAIFARDLTTGNLSFVSSTQFNATVFSALVVTPADDAVIAGGADGSVRFDHPSQGVLTPTTQTPQGPQGISALVLSSDGATLYAASATANQVVAMDPVKLTVEGSALDVPAGPAAIALSPNDSAMVVASAGGNAVSLVNIDGDQLSLAQTITAAMAPGLAAPEGVAFTPDGSFVLVTSGIGNAVLAFRRNPTTGQLAFVQAERNDIARLGGLDAPSAVVVVADGMAGPIGYVASAGGPNDPGGVATLSIDVDAPPPSQVVTQSAGMGNVVLDLSGDVQDTVSVLTASAAPDLTIGTGPDSDSIALRDTATGTTTIYAGQGDNTVSLTGARPGAAVVIDGRTTLDGSPVTVGDSAVAADSVVIAGAAANETASFYGTPGPDTVQVAGAALAASAQITLDGADPSGIPTYTNGVQTGDVLLFDPAGQSYNSGTGGVYQTLQVNGRGLVQYEHFEGVLIAAPQWSPPQTSRSKRAAAPP